MSGFKVVSDFDPKGDQPQAIKKIAKNLNDGLLNQDYDICKKLRKLRNRISL